MFKLLTVGLSLATPMFNQLVQAVIPPPHDVSVELQKGWGVQSSTGALKPLALK